MKKPVIIIAKSNEGASAGKLKYLDAEMDGIDVELRPLKLAEKVEVVKLTAASFKSIVQAFQDYRGRVVAFHYSGHANGYQLLLKDKEGTENQSVKGSGLATFLATQEGLELVFLNGCSTQGQAALYQDAGVKNIIATNQAIQDDVAHELGRAFYQSLATGASVQQAFAEAKAQAKGQTGKEAVRDLVFEGNGTPSLEEEIWQLSGHGEWTPFADAGKARYADKLPKELEEDVFIDRKKWAESLIPELAEQGVPVGNRSMDIFTHYGWLIETFLHKMQTKEGRETSMRRLSFMTEVYESSLRYLCYIQVAQIIQSEKPIKLPILRDFLTLQKSQQASFDYLSLLQASTYTLAAVLEKPFMPEIADFTHKLSNSEGDLYQATLFLERYRHLMLAGKLQEEADGFQELLDKYLTALAFWLRHIAFLAKYRMVSVKDINLNYRAGMKRQFVQLYGELHGMYSELEEGEEDYTTFSLDDIFTYNQSILLLRGSQAEVSFTDYLSLSPLLIDQSVFTDKPTQTPEIYYFIAYQEGERTYRFAQYKNELPLGTETELASNKELLVKNQNNRQPKLNELFKQLDKLCQPIRDTDA